VAGFFHAFCGVFRAVFVFTLPQEAFTATQSRHAPLNVGGFIYGENYGS
jgi:hypothetical protein